MITVNTTDLDIIRARQALAGYGIDGKRPTAWDQYGWPAAVTFDQLLTAYERTGAGTGAVHRLLDKCWQALPRVKRPDSDAVTPWETKTAEVLAAVSAWAKLRDTDRRNMVGRFSAVVYRMRDGKTWDQPLERATELVDLLPLYESQIKVAGWYEDQTADNYGQPAMFSIRTKPPGNGDTMARPESWIDVHPSRVQILAEGSVGDMFDGVPLLRAGYNALVDLEKIQGGSAEGFLKNSARTIVFKYEPGASVQAIQQADGSTKTVRQIHEEQTQALNRNQDSSIVLQGGDASTLQTTVADPTGAWQTAANVFAASVRIPFTILFGQQTGRLASDEDKADMIARAKSRQANELTPFLAQFVTRMQAAGVIEEGPFVIEWPDIGAPTDDTRLGNVGKMTSANEQAFRAGQSPIFTEDEIRKAGGYEPMAGDAGGMPGEGGNAGAA